MIHMAVRHSSLLIPALPSHIRDFNYGRGHGAGPRRLHRCHGRMYFARFCTLFATALIAGTLLRIWSGLRMVFGANAILGKRDDAGQQDECDDEAEGKAFGDRIHETQRVNQDDDNQGDNHEEEESWHTCMSTVASEVPR